MEYVLAPEVLELLYKAERWFDLTGLLIKFGFLCLVAVVAYKFLRTFF